MSGLFYNFFIGKYQKFGNKHLDNFIFATLCHTAKNQKYSIIAPS
jgi:hypothetical protein